MRSFRSIILLVAACVLCGLLFWQVIGTDSAAQDAAAGTTAVPQVWVQATFIQIDTVDFDTVADESNTTLDPSFGTVILDAAQKADLLAELKKQPSFEVLGSASLVTLTGQQALMQMVEEVRYPTEYEADGAGIETGGDARAIRVGTPVVVPKTIETREAGMRLVVTPTISDDGTLITLVLLPEVSFPAGWVNFGSKVFSQPVITSWNLTTVVRLQDGSTLVLTGVPTKNFEQSVLLGGQVGQKLKGTKSSLLLISAKVIGAGGPK